MKRYICFILALCIIGLAFCGCQSAGLNSAPPSTTTAPTTTVSIPDEEIYRYGFIDAMSYSTASELVEASGMVFLGTVKTISFEVLDVATGRIADPNDTTSKRSMFTLYEIQINTLYKGEKCETVTVAIGGGVGPKEYQEEQLQLLKSYGLEPVIHLYNASPMLEIGEEYLFTLKFREGWSTYLEGTSTWQIAFHKDSWGSLYDWEYKEVLTYFNASLEE